MYLNSSSNSYKNKYRKYKNKYQILKNQLGGACNPLPDPEDADVITGENLYLPHNHQRYLWQIRELQFFTFNNLTKLQELSLLNNKIYLIIYQI